MTLCSRIFGIVAKFLQDTITTNVAPPPFPSCCSAEPCLAVSSIGAIISREARRKISERNLQPMYIDGRRDTRGDGCQLRHCDGVSGLVCVAM